MAGSSAYPQLRGLLVTLAACSYRDAPGTDGQVAPPAPKVEDRPVSAAHLWSGATFNLAHSLSHLDRLLTPEVQRDPKSVAFHAEHAEQHARAGAMDHLQRLGAVLRRDPTDPDLFTEALEKIEADLQAGADDGDDG